MFSQNTWLRCSAASSKANPGYHPLVFGYLQALSDSYQRVLEHFTGADVLGVTATPDRGDMRNLGRFFDSRAYEYTMTQAIREHYLCSVKAQMIPLKLDISDVGMSNGDYNAGEIGTALEPYLRQIAHEIAENYADRKTVVFLPLIHGLLRGGSGCASGSQPGGGPALRRQRHLQGHAADGGTENAVRHRETHI